MDNQLYLDTFDTPGFLSARGADIGGNYVNVTGIPGYLNIASAAGGELAFVTLIGQPTLITYADAIEPTVSPRGYFQFTSFHESGTAIETSTIAAMEMRTLPRDLGGDNPPLGVRLIRTNLNPTVVRVRVSLTGLSTYSTDTGVELPAGVPYTVRCEFADENVVVFVYEGTSVAGALVATLSYTPAQGVIVPSELGSSIYLNRTGSALNRSRLLQVESGEINNVPTPFWENLRNAIQT